MKKTLATMIVGLLILSIFSTFLRPYGIGALVAADSSTMEWSKTYGGGGYDEARSIVQTSDGGYALAGFTNSFGAGSYDFWLVKTDSVGNKQWDKTYGGTGKDEAYSAVQTTEGGYALAGWTNSFGAGGEDFWLVKTDASGNKQWSRTYGGTGDDEAWSAIQTSDGGYALAGWTNSFGPGDWDFWLVKTDATGNEQWEKTYEGQGADPANYVIDDLAYSVIQTGDNGYAIVGYTITSGPGRVGVFLYDAWLVKTDATGNKQWDKTYGGRGDDECRSIIQASDGGYVLAGDTAFGSDLGNFLLIKTDATGNMQWNQTYGGAEKDETNALIQTSDGGYAMAGFTGSFGAGSWDFWLVKTDATGNKQWDNTYGGSGSDVALCMDQTNDGEYILTGYTFSFGAGGGDFYLVKTAGGGGSSGFNWNSAEGYLVIGVVGVVVIGTAWFVLSRRRRQTDSANEPSL